ncbi:MAG: DUF4433 domain-containing protein [Alphaproteobacteria bacterium]|nr:DUF4433 domain-containing protein [Alphaproteobacteria bacterium]
MANIPDKIFVFHFTAFRNLKSILQSKALKSKLVLRREKIVPINIACNNIQDKRARTLVGTGDRTLHDYVPFYFAPRSPMLYSVVGKNVPEAEETNQNNFIYFVTDILNLLNTDFRFTDYQAVSAYATFYDNQTDLDKICWELIHEKPHLPVAHSPFPGYCKYFQNSDTEEKYVKRKEARQAEFLVFESVPLGKITLIVVKNEKMKNSVENMLHEFGIKIKVEIREDWYF